MYDKLFYQYIHLINIGSFLYNKFQKRIYNYIWNVIKRKHT